MKIKWLIADVTAVGSPDRAERAILEENLAWRCFGHLSKDIRAQEDVPTSQSCSQTTYTA